LPLRPTDRSAELSNKSRRRPWPHLLCQASLETRPARKLPRDPLVRNARPRESAIPILCNSCPCNLTRIAISLSFTLRFGQAGGRVLRRRRPTRVIDHVSAIGSEPIECSFYLRFRRVGRRRQTAQIRSGASGGEGGRLRGGGGGKFVLEDGGFELVCA
jgi:hypothetical protein